MATSVYFDYSKNEAINLSKDLCPLSEWTRGAEIRFSGAVHDDGFYIFLKPSRIEESDEYKDDDPYSVSKDLEKGFHQRRLSSTIKLVNLVDNVDTANILDLGCGEGHITDAIKKKFPKSNVYGLDYSISAIKYAHRNFKGIEFVVADAYSLPYSNGSFDAVVLNNVWEHVPDPLRLLNSISTIIKPSGHIIISTPSRYRFSNLLRILRGKPIGFMSKMHVTEYSVGQMRELLAYGNYKVEMAYSDNLRDGGLLSSLLKSLFRGFITLTRSHHILESTVFYLARKIS